MAGETTGGLPGMVSAVDDGVRGVAPRLVGHLALALALAALAWPLRGSGRGMGPGAHALAETVAVLVALFGAAIALVRFYSRRSTTFLLLGTALAGTALLDLAHTVAGTYASPTLAPQLSVSPWSWFASRLFLSGFLVALAWPPERSAERARTLSDRAVYAGVALLTLGCFACFSLVPLPSAYFPDLPLSRPAELLPGLLFLLALIGYLRRGRSAAGGLERCLGLALVVGAVGQVAFMAFSHEPYDALFAAAHLAKIASYLLILVGLLGNMAALFGRADSSVAELRRMNEALQAAARDRTRAEEDRDRFFSMSIDMLAIAGFDGYFLQLNDAWQQTLGFTREELTARPYLEFVHPDDREATLREAQKLTLGGRTIDFENRYLAKDGSYRWLAWRSAAALEGGVIYAIARDIDERKKVEQMKDDFVSIVSHELRTPLTSIRGSLGLIAGGVAGELTETARSLVDIAAKNSERLVRLINDILDIEKIESGKMGFHIGPHGLASLLEQAVEANEAYAQQYGVRLELQRPVPEVEVLADPDRIQQVLTNLLSNAAKFSPHGGTVEVRALREAGRARVAITDHGPGIPAEFQPCVFERFAQADASSTRQKGGTGLGLSISRAIVERHGGELWFETREGEGTTFFVDLPEWETGREEPAPAAAAASPRLLICEDDRDIARLLALMLEQEGYETDVALDAATAKRLLAEGTYAAMTLDLVLPDQDGVSLFHEIRRDARTSSLPVVVVSARADEGRLAINGGALGVVDWLVKPIDQGRLAAAVGRAVLGVESRAARILHVEDDPDLRQVLAAIVGGEAAVEHAHDLHEARRRLAEERFDLVVLDLALPDGSGLELLPLVGGISPPVPVLIFSAYEVDAEIAGRVASVLVKSQTSNLQLLDAIRALLASG